MSSEFSLDSLRNKVDKLSYLHEVSHTINTLESIPELLDYSLKTALSALESTSGSIFLWDDKNQELTLRKSIGRNCAELEGIKKKLGEGIAGTVAQEKKPLLVKDISTDPRFQSKTQGSYKTGSFLCVPMIARDKLVGVFTVTEKESSTPFNSDELEFLYILANHLAIAADNIRLYERVKKFNQQLEKKVSEATDELKKTVDTLCVLKRYKEDILESLMTGIYVLDRENRITLWNKGMELQYQIKREEVLGKHYFEILKDTKPERLATAIKTVAERGTTVILESVKRQVNGNTEPKIINYHIYPLRSDTDTHLGVVVLLDDVTEKHHMQNQLLINEKMAAIGKLSSGIAHELNNPLDGTRRYLNLALDALTSEENSASGEFILNAREGVNRMIKIVRSLLDFSRQTGLKQPKTVNVSEVLQEVIELLDKDFDTNRIKIDENFGDHDLLVWDYGLHHVFSNLIQNAYDSILEKGKITVATRLVESEKEKTVEVLIEDTGVGIPTNVLDRIFEPFYTTKKAGEGTGLGLAICQEIVSRANGRIQVRSQEGKGTLFKIMLPVAEGSDTKVKLKSQSV